MLFTGHHLGPVIGPETMTSTHHVIVIWCPYDVTSDDHPVDNNCSFDSFCCTEKRHEALIILHSQQLWMESSPVEQYRLLECSDLYQAPSNIKCFFSPDLLHTNAFLCFFCMRRNAGQEHFLCSLGSGPRSCIGSKLTDVFLKVTVHDTATHKHTLMNTEVWLEQHSLSRSSWLSVALN